MNPKEDMLALARQTEQQNGLGEWLLTQIDVLLAAGYYAGMNRNLPQSEYVDDTLYCWLIGEWMDIVSNNGWFAMNSWLNLVHSLAG